MHSAAPSQSIRKPVVKNYQKVAEWKKLLLIPPVVYSTDYSKAVVPVLVLPFVALWFILRGDLFYVVLCYFVLVFFSPFSIVFVCVEVLRPSQPNGVMSSAVSLPKHTFTGQA